MQPSDLEIPAHLQITMKLSVIVARRTVAPVFKVTIGSTIGFEQSVDTPAELAVEGHVVARGDVQVRGDRYGVHVTERVEASHPTPGRLEVVLAETEADEMPAPGSRIEFDKSQHDTVDLVRDGRTVARGYITVLGDRIGVKVVELIVAGG